MALLPQAPRDQAMFGVTFVSVALLVAFYMYVWTPKREALVTLEARIDTLTTANEAARREMARGNAGRLRAEADEYGRMLQQMRQLVPTSNEVPALIDNISTAARRVGLDIGPMEPLGIVAGDVFDTHKWRLQVTGPYHRVSEFLTNVGNLTRIIVPMNLTLAPTARQVPGRAGEQMLDVNFEVQTYVAKSAPPPAVGAGTGGAR